MFLKFFSTIAIAICIQGCDNRPIEKSNKPFSLGGITIGVSKAEADKYHKFLTCDTKKKGTAECYLDDEEKRYDFFGASISYAKIQLHEPYEHISGIEFSTKGKLISKNEIESKWEIKDRCLTKLDIDNTLKYDGESTAPFIRFLTEINLIPTGYNDFICILPTSEVFKYNNYKNQDGSGEFFYLKEIWIRNFEYIFQAKMRMTTEKSSIEKKLNKSSASINITTNPNTCKLYEYGTDKYHENMEKLAIRIGRKDGYYDRMIESYVSLLCKEQYKDAEKMIHNDGVSENEATAINNILKK